MLEPCQQFHERLALELNELCARLSAEQSQCVAALERENVRLKAECAQLCEENARLREISMGGDPDSAAGSPRPRTSSPICSTFRSQQTPAPAPLGSVTSPLEMPPPLLGVGGEADVCVSAQSNDWHAPNEEDLVASSLGKSRRMAETAAKKTNSPKNEVVGAHGVSSEHAHQMQDTYVQDCSTATPGHDDDDDDDDDKNSCRGMEGKLSLNVVVQSTGSGRDSSPKPPARLSGRESVHSLQSLNSQLVGRLSQSSSRAGSRPGSLLSVASLSRGSRQGSFDASMFRHGSFDASACSDSYARGQIITNVPRGRLSWRSSTLPNRQDSAPALRFADDTFVNCAEDVATEHPQIVKFRDRESTRTVESSEHLSRKSHPSSPPSAPLAHSLRDPELFVAMSEYVLLDVWTISSWNNAISLNGRKSMKSMALEKVIMQELMQEEAEHWENISCHMIHPSSTKHIIWDLMGLLLIAYDCFTVPLEVFDPPHTKVFLFMIWLSRLFWTIHIYVSFSTGFMLPEGKVELNPKRVAKNYIASWFVFDVCLVLFSWAEVLTLASSDSYLIVLGRAMRGFRMFRTVKLIRMIQTPDFARFFTDKIRSEQFILCGAIAKTMIVMLTVVHLLACTWYFIGRIQPRSWLQVNDVDRQPLGSRYLWSIHWALSQFSGEALFFSSLSVIERNFTVCALFGCFMLSTYIVSSLTSSIARSQSVSSQTAALRRYLYDRRISRSLALRIENNAQFVMAEQKRTAPESSIELLKLISEPLLVELHFEMNFDVLAYHPFFRCYNEINPSAIRTLCHTAISVLAMCREDILFSEGEVPTNPRMFFPASGQLEYKQANKEPQTVTARDWLCEPVLWTRWAHHGLLRASSDCRLHVLDGTKFQKIMSRSNSHEPMDYAEGFVNMLNQRHARKEDISDIGDPFDRSLQRILEHVFPLEALEEEDEEDNDGGDSSQPASLSTTFAMFKRTSSKGRRLSGPDSKHFVARLGGGTILQKICAMLCRRRHSPTIAKGSVRSSFRSSHQGGTGFRRSSLPSQRGKAWQHQQVRRSERAQQEEDTTRRKRDSAPNLTECKKDGEIVPLS